VRTDREIPKEERRKLGLFCMTRSAVIEARASTTYMRCLRPIMPPALDDEVLAAFRMESRIRRRAKLHGHQRAVRNPKARDDAIVGKYTA